MAQQISNILNDIKDKVYVVGSYAYGMADKYSDIDLYIKEKSEEEIEKEMEETGQWSVDETYCKELIKYFEDLGYHWDSCFPQTFNVFDTEIPLDLSAYFDVDNKPFEIEIFGVKMQAMKCTKTNDKYLNGIKREKLKTN